MSNFRAVNDEDILKEFYYHREGTYLCYTTDKDRENEFHFDKYRNKILNNIPKKNRQFVENQLITLYDEFSDYISYMNEKYYRNGFVDGVQMICGCLEE